MTELEEKEEKREGLKEKIKKFSIVAFIAAFFIIILFIAALGINIGDLMVNIVQDFYDSYGIIGIYIGIFLISIFGNVSVIFPVPYVIALAVLAIAIPEIDPWLLGISAGLGAAIGETSAWVLGRGGKEVIEDTRMEKDLKLLVV